MAEQFRLGHRPALDGMRAFAVLAVLGVHAGLTGMQAGHLGVDVFFTLSGFLITALLVEELRANDGVWLAGFWARRVLRLVPALVVFLAVVWTAAAWLTPGTRNGVVPALLYYMNWHLIAGGSGGAITHTWSLAIEEQFYLLWPLMLVGLWKLDRTLGVAVRVTSLVAVSSFAARLAVAQEAPFWRWYRDFFLRADSLLIGCVLALVIYRQGRVPNALRGSWCIPAGVAVFVAVFAVTELGVASPTYHASLHTVAALATAAVIVGIVNGTAPAALAHPVAVWIGTRSYGIYLWHVVFMRNSIITTSSADVVWAFVLTFITAELSYRLVEAPFLRLKSYVRVRGEQRSAALALTRS